MGHGSDLAPAGHPFGAGQSRAPRRSSAPARAFPLPPRSRQGTFPSPQAFTKALPRQPAASVALAAGWRGGKLAKYFSIAWKTGCKRWSSSHNRCRRAGAFIFHISCEAERQRSPGDAPCASYGGTPCSPHCVLLSLQKPVGEGIALVKSMVPDEVVITLLVVHTPETKLEVSSRIY